VWNPEQQATISAATHHMNTDYNIFEGYKVKGGPAAVFVRGTQVVDGDKWVGRNGYGQFVKRSPHAPVI
jgi:dihydropyrimidinase